MFIYFIIAALIVLLDQVSKYFLTLYLAGGSAELIPGLVRMQYMQNTGAAFNFLSDMRWVLVIVSAVVSVLVIIGMIRYRGTKSAGSASWGSPPSSAARLVI